MTVKCKAEESLTCSCVDVGTIIDGSDCSVEVHQFYSTEADANAALERLTKKRAIQKAILAKLKAKSWQLKTAFN